MSRSKASQYNNWNREDAVQRALKHAERVGAINPDGTIWNFAFGSNLSAEKVKSRGLKPKDAINGKLENWSLIFNHVGGFANIETSEIMKLNKKEFEKVLPQPIPTETHGVLIKLTGQDFADLAWQEYAYDTVDVDVEPYCRSDGKDGMYMSNFSTLGSPSAVNRSSGEKIKALAFKTAACALADPKVSMPSKRYISIIREGAKSSGLDRDYADWLDKIPFQ